MPQTAMKLEIQQKCACEERDKEDLSLRGMACFDCVWLCKFLCISLSLRIQGSSTRDTVLSRLQL